MLIFIVIYKHAWKWKLEYKYINSGDKKYILKTDHFQKLGDTVEARWLEGFWFSSNTLASLFRLTDTGVP